MPVYTCTNFADRSERCLALVVVAAGRVSALKLMLAALDALELSAKRYDGAPLTIDDLKELPGRATQFVRVLQAPTTKETL